MNHFWMFNQLKDDPDGERELVLDGAIAEESWFDDDVTPEAFRVELNRGTGNIVVIINSPGGDCVAAAQIYNMLCEYPGKVTVRIDGIAASAASVVAMAGDRVTMSPVSLMMIHNPLTIAWGDRSEMDKAIALLDEVKESIINAYETKTALPRAKISALMDAETWMSSGRALELGFADDVCKPQKKNASAPDGESPTGETGTNLAPRYAYAMNGVSNAAVRKALARVRGDAEPHPADGNNPPEPHETVTDRDRASFALTLAQVDASL